MKTEESRNRFNVSNKYLRRARRLYVAVCLEQIEKYGNIAIDCMAIRAQKSGLYSEKTNIRAIRQSINSHHFQLTKIREGCTGSAFDWHNWCKKMDISARSGYFNHKKKIVIPAVIDKAPSEDRALGD